jgi:hypothetical protein
LGKNCGVELHLHELINSIHDIKSGSIAPYLEHNHQKICRFCDFLLTDICPCPLRYLAVLIAEAVEAVDERRASSAAEPAEEPVGC